MNYKTVSDSVKDVDVKSGIVTLLFSKFGNIDAGEDMVMPGAFKKTIRELGPNGKDRIMHLWQHSTWDIIGKPVVIKETSEGGYAETKFNVKRDFVRDKLEMYQDGTLKEHSFGYDVIDFEPVKDSKGKIKYNQLKELKLWEYSTVTWGMNEEAQFQGFKSLKDNEKFDILTDKLERFEKALRNGRYTDETYHMIEIEIKQLKGLVNSLNIIEPVIETTCNIEPSEMIESFMKGYNK